MGMTKRWIDELRDKADAGDAEAQETLSSAGLWQSEEDAAAEAEAYHFSDDCFEGGEEGF